MISILEHTVPPTIGSILKKENIQVGVLYKLEGLTEIRKVVALVGENGVAAYTLEDHDYKHFNKSSMHHSVRYYMGYESVTPEETQTGYNKFKNIYA